MFFLSSRVLFLGTTNYQWVSKFQYQLVFKDSPSGYFILIVVVENMYKYYNNYLIRVSVYLFINTSCQFVRPTNNKNYVPSKKCLKSYEVFKVKLYIVGKSNIYATKWVFFESLFQALTKRETIKKTVQNVLSIVSAYWIVRIFNSNKSTWEALVRKLRNID